MKQKKRRNHVLSLIVIFILVAIVFGAAWGVVTILDRLSYYGESTTIQTDPIESVDEQETPVPDEEEEESALPANLYEASGFSEKSGLKV